MAVRALIIICMLISLPVLADDGVWVIDGDTLLVDGKRFRFDGIDAPELSQSCVKRDGNGWPCGLKARDSLIEITKGQVECEISGRDRYGRTLGTCYADGRDVQAMLVRQGLALAYRQYSTAYIADEDVARKAKRGIWAGTFVAPWDWRARH